MSKENITEPYRNLFKQLEQEFDPWRAHYKDLVDYCLPMHGKNLASRDQKANDGTKKGQKIINDIGTDALTIQTLGMAGGLIPKAKPWFHLTLRDRDLVEYEPVKQWLHMVTEGMREIFARSNFYETSQHIFRECGCFGTSINLLEEDPETVIRCRPFTIGEYFLALDKTYRPVIMTRQYAMKARQILAEFGEDNCSDSVKTAAKEKASERYFEIIHFIMPNGTIELDKDDRRGMPFESVYYEYKNETNKMLRQSGYREQPFSVLRWDVVGVNTYGNSYIMGTLGHIKSIQKMESKKLMALEKLVNPPLNVPTELKHMGANILPGAQNYVDVLRGQSGITPIYQVSPDVEKIGLEIQRLEQKVRSSCFNDLFVAILNSDKNMTATEIAQRHEEKVQLVGPVVHRAESDYLDKIIKRTFKIMERNHMLPPIPPEMEGMDLKIEYTSLLSRAARMVEVAGIEQVAGFVGSLAPVIPDVVDKFDADQAVDEYADSIGIPPDVIRSDDEVAKIREARNQQIQQQIAMEQMAQGAQTGKALSETEMNKNSALDALLSGFGEV